MAGPNRGPRGGFQKPKNMGKTAKRLMGYVTHSKLPLILVLLCLLASVASNLGGSYMMRGIINDFVYKGCNDFVGLGMALSLAACGSKETASVSTDGSTSCRR